VEKAKTDQKKKLDEEAEQTAAEVEPMGSVAAAVPRDAGSAPDHQGGHGTVVAGKEARKAEQPAQRKTVKDHKRHG
jgi:hypothetical protein